MKKYLRNFYKYRYLLYEIVRKNIKLQYRDSFLGILWTFLQPLLTTIVLVVVFGNLLGKDSSKVLNYPVYLLCGRLLYDFFAEQAEYHALCFSGVYPFGHTVYSLPGRRAHTLNA